MATEARKKEIRAFVVNRFWPAYPRDLAGRGIGSRENAINSMIKIKPTDEECEEIFQAMEAQKRFDRAKKKKGHDVKFWPMVSTYLNQRIYRDPIEGAMYELELGGTPMEDAKKCECGAPVLGPKFDACPDCWAAKADRWAALRKKHELKRAEGETDEEYIRRIKVMARKAITRMGGAR